MDVDEVDGDVAVGAGGVLAVVVVAVVCCGGEGGGVDTGTGCSTLGLAVASLAVAAGVAFTSFDALLSLSPPFFSSSFSLAKNGFDLANR